MRNGYGSYTYANGDVYKGDWMDNLRHGSGWYTYKEGYYSGEWDRDMK